MRKVIGWILFSLGIVMLIANLTYRIIFGETNLLDFTFWTQLIIPGILCYSGWRMSHKSVVVLE